MSLQSTNENLTASGLNPEKFNAVVDGKQVKLYVLVNARGAEACITNYGGRVVSLMVPDRDGKLTDVELGYDNIDDYVKNDGNYGALIGRYGNRIGQAQFSIDGNTYHLPVNNGPHCLHGGPKGFDKLVWDATQEGDNRLVLTLVSADGDAGFPGNLSVKVVYTLTDDNALDIDYSAVTDKPTVVNLTNHSYFNLNGDLSSSIHNHEVMIDANVITPSDETLITDGSMRNILGSPLDFTTAKPLGRDIAADYDQLINGNGYDQNFVLNNRGDINKVAATCYSPVTGILMEILTSEPGLQIYTGNFLDGQPGKHGVPYPERSAVAFETQHYPNTPNCPSYPSCELRPGETYATRTIYRFKVK